MELLSMKGAHTLAQTVKQIHKDFKTLANPILSIYLQTHPARSDWKIRLKNGLNRMKEYIECSNQYELDAFTKIRTNVEQKIQDHQTSLTKSLICFAAPNRTLLYRLQIPVQNDFQWKYKPADEQLQQLLQQYPKSGIFLLQHGKITIITSLLGEVLEEIAFYFDFQTNHWQKLTSTSENNHTQSSDGYMKRFRKNQIRWYKKITPTLKRYIHQKQFKRLYVTGPSQLRKILKNHLNIQFDEETNHNYAGKDAHRIIEKLLLTSISP